MFRSARSAVLLGLIASASLSCRGETIRRRNVVVLVDYSGSMSTDQMQRYSQTIAHEVVANLRDHDAVAIYPIDAGAVVRNNQIAGVDLTQRDFSGKNDGVTHAAEAVHRRVIAYLDSAVDSVLLAVKTGQAQRLQFAGKTDIIGAIQGTSAHFEHTKDVGKGTRLWDALVGQPHVDVDNVLVICSDMINESDAANFESNPPSARKVDSLIKLLKDSGRVPNLEGAAIFVTGRTGRDAHQVEAIKEFWTRYFKESSGALKAYDYDTSKQLRQYFLAQ